jgi:sorting nexin-13
VQEFVTDLWYSSITPDQEVLEQIYLMINDVIGEISQRVRHINLIGLLTRDMVDLIGSHLELHRRNQARIGVHVMGTLSSKERDERLKHCSVAAKELHPALISPEDEYKVRAGRLQLI